MTDGTGTTSYTHDLLGRLTGTSRTPTGGGNPTTVGYTFDDAGRLTTITYPGNHTLARGYDNADRLTTVTDWANRTLTYTWTPDNTLATAAYPNGVTTTNTYDPTGNLTATTAATANATVLDLAYGYDNAGLLTTDTDQTDPATPVTCTYTYDPLARVNTVTGGPAPDTYTFDDAGHLTSAPGSTQLFDAAGQLTNSGTLTNPTTHTHDSLGQRTASTTTPPGGDPATTTYSYDAAGQLTAVTPPTGTSDTHTYDGDGLRATTTHTTAANTTTDTYTWDLSGNLPLLLQDATNTYLYGLGSSPYAQINNTTGAITYLHADQLGSTRTTTDNTATTTGTWTFDTYGNQTAHTGTGDTPFLYAGQYRDPATGLYYLRARHYDPATGQFLTRDPLTDTTRQPYAYTSGNPLQATDPSGLCSITTWLRDAGNLLTHGPRVGPSACDVEDQTITNSISKPGDLAAADLMIGQSDLAQGFLEGAGGPWPFGQQPCGPWASAGYGMGSAWIYSLGAIDPAAGVTGEGGILARGVGRATAAPKLWTWPLNKAATAAKTAGSGAVDRVGSAVSRASEWLGPDARAITNGAGDKIFLSKDGLRRIRTDINRPYPHQSPHAHVEELVNGSWVKSGPIYPTDVPAG
jgi:RHS repeat-associated protein